MIYDVLVVSNVGGERRFTTERDAPLSDGETFEEESESYRVLAIQAGHGPFDAVIEAEWLASRNPAHHPESTGRAASRTPSTLPTTGPRRAWDRNLSA
jgi:hypothetical protein